MFSLLNNWRLQFENFIQTMVRIVFQIENGPGYDFNKIELIPGEFKGYRNGIRWE